MADEKQKILIVDDSEMNRELLIDLLEDKYTAVEAKNGMEALDILKDRASEFSVMLLDINMPEMNGFEVLTYMREYGWIKNISVIMITADDSPDSIEHAYNLGAFDYISRPFDLVTVQRRISNTMIIAAKQRYLEATLAERMARHEKDNKLMISILSHLMEFKNGEVGRHIINTNIITTMLLQKLLTKTDKYPISWEDIDLITTASSLHDIGKTAIPDEILNKPGRLTAEEFEIMKTHTTAAADMLKNIAASSENNPLLKTSYEICRWHHERYDGRGYPDGLKGDEIPISAQIVGLSDVYEALTSERCYKPPFTHEKAVNMIVNGECGAFNPILMESFLEISDLLAKKLSEPVDFGSSEKIELILEEPPSENEIVMRTVFDREASKFLADTSGDVVFFYTFEPSALVFNERGAETFGIAPYVISPEKNEELKQKIPEFSFPDIKAKIENLDPDTQEIKNSLSINGKDYGFIGRVIWEPANKTKPIGMAGKLILKSKQKVTEHEKAQ